MKKTIKKLKKKVKKLIKKVKSIKDKSEVPWYEATEQLRKLKKFDENNLD